MKSSDDTGSSDVSDPPTVARGRATGLLRTVAEVGAVVILSCAIIGSAWFLRQDKAGDAPPTASRRAEPTATSQADPPAKSQADPTAVLPSEQRVVPKEGPWIHAEPNPVPFAGEKGTTTITWDAAGSKDATVYLRGAEKEELFSGGITGKETIDWISPGGVYTFVLYADGDRKTELAILEITRPAEQK